MRAPLRIALLLASAATPTAVQAQNAAHVPSEQPTLSGSYRFSELTGAELFMNVCQGCHMPDGKGAVGAGAYPSIASNTNLQSGGYPVYVVVNGQRAMPAFGSLMSDDQVAAVVNYVRTHFGNNYQDTVTAEDVRIIRR